MGVLDGPGSLEAGALGEGVTVAVGGAVGSGDALGGGVGDSVAVGGAVCGPAIPQPKATVSTSSPMDGIAPSDRTCSSFHLARSPGGPLS